MTLHAQRGGSMVETMLVMALLLTVVCGMMEAGRALYTYHAVANGARLGARYAIVRGSACAVAGCPASKNDIRDYVRSETLFVDSSALSVDTTWPGNTGCTDPANKGRGCLVIVQVTYPFNWSVPFVPLPTLTMRSTSQMLISQ